MKKNGNYILWTIHSINKSLTWKQIVNGGPVAIKYVIALQIFIDLVIFEILNIGLKKKTNKQHRQTIYSFNDIQAPGLHIIQYCNIYKAVVILMIIKKTVKTIYIEGLVHHVGKWLIRKTLSKVKTTFKGANNLNIRPLNY